MSTTPTETAALLAFVCARVAEAAPLDAAMDAAWPGLPAGITLEEARRRTSAALAAAGVDDTLLILRQTVALYEQAVEQAEALRGQLGSEYGTGSEIAAESYLTVIRLHAARWSAHPDYRPEFRCGWMDTLEPDRRRPEETRTGGREG